MDGRPVLHWLRQQPADGGVVRSAIAVAPVIKGPTNLPPIEALVLGTPIITVRSFDVPKQVGKAALRFDPLHVDELAGARQVNTPDKRYPVLNYQPMMPRSTCLQSARSSNR